MKVQFKAKKKWSQNFLVDQNIKLKLQKNLNQFLNIYPDYDLLEIGPGLGDLTEVFLATRRKLLAIEIDLEMVEFLQKRFDQYLNSSFFLEQADFLQLVGKDQNSLDKCLDTFGFDPQKTLIVSNLPFTFGSRILVDIAVKKPQLPVFAILQKEVVDKATALDAKNFQFFGAWLNLFWQVEKFFDISPSCFKPKPKVYSTLFTAQPKFISNQYPASLKPLFCFASACIDNRIKLKKCLKALLASPKKLLSNNLKNYGLSKEEISNFYDQNNLDKNCRLNGHNYQDILNKLVIQGYL